MADATKSTPAGPFSLLGKVEGAEKAFLALDSALRHVFDAAGVTIDACPARVVLRG